MIKLLHESPEIAPKALRVATYNLCRRSVRLGSLHLASGCFRPTFQNQTIAAALIVVGLTLITSSWTHALPASTGGDPGYQEETITQVLQIGNRRGRDPIRKERGRRLENADTNGSNTNYLLTIPVLTLPARGLNVALALCYNSQVWTLLLAQMVFDYGSDWPAPGWLLSFGRVTIFESVGFLQDADGTLHPLKITSPVGAPELAAHTTDGSLIDYTEKAGPNNTVLRTAKFPDGATVIYGATSYHTSYATRITDANGNIISISYLGDSGPALQEIHDSVGRVLGFNYDANHRLVAITAPGLYGNTRAVLCLHYSPKTLAYSFPVPVEVAPPKPVYLIDALYFPGTSTGYWFADADSYSSYGMISKVSQRRGMTLTGASSDDQGTLTAGIMTREYVYDYPSSPSSLLNGPPTYTKMTESWAGMDIAPVVTTYSVNSDASPRTVDTVYPDGTRVSEFRYNLPGQFDDNLLYSQITYDPSGNRLKQIDTKWSLEDYDSPVVSNVKVIDQLGQARTIVYDYARDVYGYDSPPTNQLADIKQIDYDGKTVLRSVYFNYVNIETDPGYAQRHIFNLPVSVITQDGQGQLASRTDYAYDHQPLANTPGVVGHDSASDPNLPGYDPTTDYRGNITQITRYKSVYPNWDGITESRRYDIAGNLIAVSGSGCVNTNFTYTVNTQYAYPEKVTCGAMDPQSTARESQSFTYDFSTGLTLTVTDVNGLTTSTIYDASSLRAKKVQLAAGASRNYTYDDSNGVITQIVEDGQGLGTSVTLTRFNGRGLVQSVESAVSPFAANKVSWQYDAMGRVWKRSQPYRQEPAFWTVFSYDSLGRVTSVQNPDGSQKRASYNESNRPSSASKIPGETTRQYDETFREKWFRIDALGQLAEVVEPPANGNGSVFEPGNVETSYSYNGLGLLTRLVQGADQQERDFQYDPLGRLTAEYLPEKSRTLDASGNYIGQQGQWSDIFSYDDHSNLISHVDARGVKVLYEFANDPLNRLQSLSYEASGGVDPSSPIVPTLPSSYAYVTTGDVTRLASITRPSGTRSWWEQEQYSYDPQGRLASKTLLFSGQSQLVSTCKYDSLNRLSEKIYPIEYGTPRRARKKLHYSYGIGGFLTDLKIDGVEYASQLAYNPAGQTISITVGPTGMEQTKETYGFDPATNLLVSQQVQRGSAALLNLTYIYLRNGQLKLVEEGTAWERYNYDELGRLASVYSDRWSEMYSYDVYGNKTRVAASGEAPDGSPMPLDGLAGSPTPANGLSALTYDPKTNHVTTPGFAYDAAGNQTRAQRSDGSWVRYRYDQAGRLAQVTDDDGKVLEEYRYGADGRRLQKIIPSTGSTFYFWDGNQVIAEYDQPKALPKWVWSKSYAYLGNRILATFIPKESGEEVYYQHPDRLGTRLVTNSVDNIAPEQLKLPFGTLIPNGSSYPINPIFTSYDRSLVTGLDYALNRDYHSLERFLQPDPAGIAAVNPFSLQSFNLYSYAGNDPINGIDASGLGILSDIGQVVRAFGAAGGFGYVGALWQSGAVNGYLVATCAELFGLTAAVAFDLGVELYVANMAVGSVKQDIMTVLSNSGGGFYAGTLGASTSNYGYSSNASSPGAWNTGDRPDTSGPSSDSDSQLCGTITIYNPDGTVSEETQCTNGFNPEGDYTGGFLPAVVIGPGVASYDPEGNNTPGAGIFPHFLIGRNPVGPAGTPNPEGGGPIGPAATIGLEATPTIGPGATPVIGIGSFINVNLNPSNISIVP